MVPILRRIFNIFWFWDINPLIQSFLKQLFKLVTSFWAILFSFPDWPCIQLQMSSRVKNIWYFGGIVYILQIFSMIKQIFFHFRNPIRFLMCFCDHFEVKVILIRIILDRIVEIQHILYIISQVINIFNKRFLIVIK